MAIMYLGKIMLYDKNVVLLHLCDYLEAGLRDLGQFFLLHIGKSQNVPLRENPWTRQKQDKQILAVSPLPIAEVGDDRAVFTEQLLGCTPNSAGVLFIRLCRFFHVQTSHLGCAQGPGRKFQINILAKQLSKY